MYWLSSPRRILEVVCLAFAFCASSLVFAAHRGAEVTFELPGGGSYTIPKSHLKPEHLRALSHTSAVSGNSSEKDASKEENVKTEEAEDEKESDQSSKTTINVKLSGTMGYSKFCEQKTRPQGTGTFYVTLIATGDECIASDIGIQLSKGEETQFTHPVVLNEKTMSISANMAGHVAGHVSVAESGTKTSFPKGPTVDLLTQKGYVFAAKIDDVEYDELNLLSPTINIQGQNFKLTHGGTVPPLPELDLAVILHFVPAKGTDEISIHMTRAAASTSAADRELTTVDIQDLANLMTFDRLAAVLRHGKLDDAIISQKRSAHASNLTEGCVQLLTELQSKEGADFTSEYLAGLFEQEHLNAIAERIRTGKIALSAEDQDLQLEMLSLGAWIDRKSSAIALSMGMTEKDVDAVKEEDSKQNGQPGYKLLHIAYTKSLLHKFYPACNAEKLIEIRAQVEEDHRFPLLEDLLIKEPVTNGSSSGARKVIKVSPVQFDDIDPFLLHASLNGDKAGHFQWEGVRTEEDAASLVTRLATAVGKPRSFRANYDVFKEIGYGGSFLEAWDPEKTWGNGVTYGKFLDALNCAEDIECASLARHVINTIKSGSVEKELSAYDYFKLAAPYRESNPTLAYSLLARIPLLDRPDIPREEAHAFRVKCTDWNCGGYSSYGGRSEPKVCASYPSLQQKLQSEGARPYQFKYPSK